jgi:hypothetical protein
MQMFLTRNSIIGLAEMEPAEGPQLADSTEDGKSTASRCGRVKRLNIGMANTIVDIVDKMAFGRLVALGSGRKPTAEDRQTAQAEMRRLENLSQKQKAA